MSTKQTNHYRPNVGTIKFAFVDYPAPILAYKKAKPSSHKVVFMKDHRNRIWMEPAYKGDAVFGGMNYFDLLTRTHLSDARIQKLDCDTVEMGIKLFLGETKLYCKKNGETVEVELKYPELCIEDERLWHNRKPYMDLSGATTYPESAPGYICSCECECDYCLECNDEMDRLSDTLSEMSM